MSVLLGHEPEGQSLALVPTSTPIPPAADSAGLVRPDAALRELVPPFLGWLALVRQRAANTVKSYGEDLRAFADFCERYRITAPARVTFHVVEAYMAWLTAKQGRAAATANRHRYAIQTFFRFLRREGLATVNPVEGTSPFKQSQRLPKYLTIPEQERVLAALAEDTSLRGRRDLALVATALLCGLRVGELAALRVEDVDLDTGRLRVVGKGDKERECAVIPRLRAILEDYLVNVRPALCALRILGWLERHGGARNWCACYTINGKRVRENTRTADREEAERVLADLVAEQRITQRSPYLFIRAGHRGGHHRTKGSRALLTRSIFLLIRRRLTAIVGRPVHPHMLRHSFASRLRENGADLVLIQEALGHASITTTTIYAHLTSAKRRADVARYLDPDRARGREGGA